MPGGANAGRRGAVLGGASRRVNRRDYHRRKCELLAVQRPNEVKKKRGKKCVQHKTGVSTLKTSAERIIH